MKNILILLLFFSYSFAAYPQNSEEPFIFGKMLTELKEPKKPEWPLPKDLKISPVGLSAPLDTTYNWKLLYYQKQGWTQIVGQERSDYEKTYINTKPEMTFTSALLKRKFKLSEPASNWKIRQQPSTSGSIYLIISSYRGNPYANATSWEEEEFYVFTEYGLHENTPFMFDYLLEETADPMPFHDERSVTGAISVLHPYTVTDSSSWQLLGYEEWAWQDILGKDAHVTNYRKYTAKAAAAFSGKGLKQEFKLVNPGIPPQIYSSMGWQSYSMDDGTMVIQMNTYQAGNMTNWGYTSSYYFYNIK